MIKSKYITTVKVTDPDTGQKVEIEVRKLETGGMLGIDCGFLEKTSKNVYSPYKAGYYVDVVSED
jgi:hypothetical protein